MSSIYFNRWGQRTSEPHCWSCDEIVRKDMRCANCMTAIYCDKICQTHHWKMSKHPHKLQCKKIIEKKKLKEEQNRRAAAQPTPEEILKIEEGAKNFVITPEKMKEVVFKIIMDELKSVNTAYERRAESDIYDYSFVEKVSTTDYECLKNLG